MTNNERFEKGIKFIVKNWKKIPETFKTDLKGEGYYGNSTANVTNLPENDHKVVILLSRQKPSVEASWDFDEERITVSRTGKIVWGFDSGCSCPSPWHDNYPNCYTCTDTWKEFETELSSFDEGAVSECLDVIEEIRKAVKA